MNPDTLGGEGSWGTPSTAAPTCSTAGASPSSLSSARRGQNALYTKQSHSHTAGKGDGDAPKMAGQPRLRGGRAGGERDREGMSVLVSPQQVGLGL